jgi:hypothetical protein
VTVGAKDEGSSRRPGFTGYGLANLLQLRDFFRMKVVPRGTASFSRACGCCLLSFWCDFLVREPKASGLQAVQS